MKRRLPVILILLAVIGGALYYYRAQTPDSITLTGIVTTDDIIVSSQVSGRLDKLYVRQGDKVKQGDLIAEIQPAQWQADMSFYENSQKQAATQVSQAQADLRFQESQTQYQVAQAQANVAAAQAQVTQAQADLDLSKATLTREEEMYKKGVESVQAYDEARLGYEAKKAHVDALQKQVAAAQAAVDLAKSNGEQVAAHRATVEMNEHQRDAAAAQMTKAQVQLGYTKILAPSDGIVDVRAALEGEVVNPAQAIVTLINPEKLWVRADVEETYIDKIHMGDKLTIRLPSGATREGTVIFRGIDADFATQRDVSRTKRDIKTFEVRLACDNSDHALAVGMTANDALPLAKTSTPTAP